MVFDLRLLPVRAATKWWFGGFLFVSGWLEKGLSLYVAITYCHDKLVCILQVKPLSLHSYYCVSHTAMPSARGLPRPHK